MTLTKGLHQILGFMQERIFGNKVAANPPDLRRGIYSLYVYCDICSEMLVRNSLAPLLRTVSFQKTPFGKTINIIYSNPIHVPCMTRSIDTVQVQICDDTGRLVPFIEGKTVLFLHLRKRL